MGVIYAIGDVPIRSRVVQLIEKTDGALIYRNQAAVSILFKLAVWKIRILGRQNLKAEKLCEKRITLLLHAGFGTSQEVGLTNLAADRRSRKSCD